ncbi:hypothetical protein DUF1484 [Cupriavidus necator N-1]|jgi:hypothetical protein|uniref:DUF1484 family protein n=1 Tax=Cupriavidus necator (strain ATCC 43291 / DSM 13513 / CCUG 52238 / LMG 8453 / N-1) TaxID=1042878 RepID=G0EZ78_CUPNN|nr:MULTISPECIES: DUF1484 family protein [Cupriavidus]AEI77458.1 hypothetical protein DUF1484 [Cupriavidus necator N-1]KAI3598141.1 hypothetical protein D8I24_6007 [Cupriavidus necator H850]MDX6014002.1 DUF1484 family protein [Cupriavidus necator]QUN26941.1 DUF1484 family protein [Cupriavidus sp. KK10]
MQDQTASKQDIILAAIPDCLYSLGRVSAGLGCVLSLLEVESERSEVCHGVHCLVAMLKAQLDQTAEELLRTSELGSDVAGG